MYKNDICRYIIIPRTTGRAAGLLIAPLTFFFNSRPHMEECHPRQFFRAVSHSFEARDLIFETADF